MRWKSSSSGVSASPRAFLHSSPQPQSFWGDGVSTRICVFRGVGGGVGGAAVCVTNNTRAALNTQNRENAGSRQAKCETGWPIILTVLW